jgi:hypothetical protein
MITITFTRTDLEKIYREGCFAVLPENLGLLSPELAAALADIVLDNLLGGICL